jgi:hypothetical protein
MGLIGPSQQTFQNMILKTFLFLSSTMQTAIHSATCHWLTGAHWHSDGESTERFWAAWTPPTGSTKETSLGKQNNCIAEDSTLSVDANFMLKRHHHNPVRKALLQGRRVKTKNVVIYRYR